MKYFITGANGFIGKAVCSYLENKGEEIVKHIRLGKYTGSHVLARECDVIIHLSAYGNHYHQTDVYEIVERNINDLLKLIEIAKQSKSLVKFYNISTSSVTLPVQTMYSASKLFGETLINSLKDERFVNVRPYSVFGPGEAAHRFIPTVIRCLKTGETMQLNGSYHDWIFISDFIEAMFSGETEIGTGERYSNVEIKRMLEEISGKKLNFEPMPLRIYDNKNWVCKKGVKHIPIYEALKLTYEST